MPLVKSCCAVCKTSSPSMWTNQGEILCNTCTGKSTNSGGSSASASSTIQQNNGQGKQSKQEIHRQKCHNQRKDLGSTSTFLSATFYPVTCTSCDWGVFYQIGDVIKVGHEDDGKLYYAQIHGFVQDQGLIPTQSSPQDRFDPSTLILGPEEDLPRKMEYLEFMSCPIRVFKSRSCLFPTIPVRPEKGYNWTDTSLQDTEDATTFD
uniref:GATA zinc finger domain containing 1 n=1 Tax=Sinocyclocheilus grahami TaxID=75366 RepID=A0A672REI8_SINGR